MRKRAVIAAREKIPPAWGMGKRNGAFAWFLGYGSHIPTARRSLQIRVELKAVVQFT